MKKTNKQEVEVKKDCDCIDCCEEVKKTNGWAVLCHIVTGLVVAYGMLNTLSSAGSVENILQQIYVSVQACKYTLIAILLQLVAKARIR